MLIAWGLTQGIVRVAGNVDSLRGPVFIAAIGMVLRALTEWIGSVVAQRHATIEKSQLRQALAARILRHGRADLKETEGELAWLGTSGLDGLDAWHQQVVPAISASAVVPALMLIAIGLVDWISAVIILVTLPLVPVFMWLIGTYTQDRVAVAADEIARLSSHVVELARGLPAMVGLHRAAEQSEALGDISTRERQRTMQTLRTAFLSSLALELISTISVALVAVVVGLRLAYGHMSLADGFLVLLLAPECFTPIRQVGMAYHAAEDGTEAAHRARQIINQPTPGHSSTWETTLSVRDLHVRYPDRATDAVQAISFDVLPGEIVALTGPSGCGKSTILAALAGTVVDSELATVHGTIAGIDPDRVAYVSQHPRFVTNTVADELVLAGATDIERLLEQVHAAHLRERNPAELSLGELRRVAMARALARIENGADLLLLDEPTAHLDTDSAHALHATLNRLPAHVRVVLVAHDTATRRMAHRCVSLGEVDDVEATASFETGTPVRRTMVPVPPIGKSSIWEVLRLLRPARANGLAALFFDLLTSASAIALTALSGWLIVRASEQPPIMYLMVAIVGVRFFGIGRAVFRYVERLYLHDLILESISTLRTRMWASLAASGPRTARWLQPGMALGVLVGQLDVVRDLAPRVILPPITIALTLALTALGMVFVQAQAALVLLAAAFVTLAVVPWLTLRVDRAAAMREEATGGRLRQWFGSFVSAAADIRGNALDTPVLARLSRMDDELTSLALRGAWSTGVGTALVTLAIGSASVAALHIGGQAGMEPRMLALVVLVPLALIEVSIGIVPAVRQWPQLQAAAGRVASIVDGDAEPVVRESWPIPEIDLDDVTLRWPGLADPVVESLSVHVDRGDWVAVLGPSGGGKSTVFAALMGLLPPEKGTITAGNRPIGRHARIAWCPQEAHIFDSTIRGNLLLARPRVDAPSDATLWRVLGIAGLDDLVRELPAGLDARVGPAGSFLSGGQRQRLAIARTLLADADVVLLDEPTAHLDTRAARTLLARLRTDLADRIVFIITHNMHDVEPTDVVVHVGRYGGVDRVAGAAVMAGNARQPLQ